MTGFAAGLSEHPTSATAVEEAIGRVVEGLGRAYDNGGPPDLALLFVTPPHLRGLDDIAAAVMSALSPGTLIGCAAVSVVGGSREVETEPAVSLWAGHTGPVVPFHLTAAASPEGPVFAGWPDQVPGDASALLLLADPFTFPTDDFLAWVAGACPGLPVVGGMASAAQSPGGNRLVIDAAVHREGAVGAFLGPRVSVSTVVSQGCRPVGQPLVITRAEANVVFEMAGKPAIERLQEVAASLTDEDRELLARHVHLGRVIDERKVDFERGDFLVRNVYAASPELGYLAVGDAVAVGDNTQFHVRDATTADEDLRQLMSGRSADAALVFTCNGRGVNLFGEPDHDASVVSESLGGAPTAGMFCAGELGPVGGRNFVHGFTASVVLLSGA
ncbi:MAG: FIST signal transduction protein [Acidimicrobiales bacterium]